VVLGGFCCLEGLLGLGYVDFFPGCCFGFYGLG